MDWVCFLLQGSIFLDEFSRFVSCWFYEGPRHFYNLEGLIYFSYFSLLQKREAQRDLLLFAYWLLLGLHFSPRSWALVIRFDIFFLSMENGWYFYILNFHPVVKFDFKLQLGAFLAGALLAETNFRTQIEADIRPFRGLLLGLFFVTTGTSIDMQVYNIMHCWIS